MFEKVWGGRWGSNPRQPESQSGTLPTELLPPSITNIVEHKIIQIILKKASVISSKED